MLSLSDRLERVGDFAWASVWTTLATLVGGAVLGGVLGLIPFLSTNPKPEYAMRLGYFGGLGVGALVTLLCIAAALTTHKERSESIAAIKADLDKNLVYTFEDLPSDGPAEG